MLTTTINTHRCLVATQRRGCLSHSVCVRQPCGRQLVPIERAGVLASSAKKDKTTTTTTTNSSSSSSSSSQAPDLASSSAQLPAAGEEQEASTSSSSGRLVLLVALVGAAALILTAAGGVGGLKDKVSDLEAVIAGAGPLGPLIYGSAYTTATVLLFPASLLTLGAGFLFGPLKGTAIVSASSTAGASLAFLVSRFLARPFVEQQLAGNEAFQKTLRNVSADGGKLVLLLRLSPLVPFNLLNYGLGLTSVGFLDYVVASWAGMLPATFAYVYLGSVGKVAADAAAEGAGGAGSLDAAKTALYVVGALATVAATKLISDAATKAIDSDDDDDDRGKK